MIDNEHFFAALTSFQENEGRADFFPLACRLLNNEFRVEAHLFILATWNFAAFRYVTKTFHIAEFGALLERLEENFQALSGLQFRNVNFHDLTEPINAIYGQLSTVRGVKYTGASKLMHLRNPNLFVMWDSYIRGEDRKWLYEELPIVQSNDWPIKKYGTDTNGYLEFLSDIQARFAHIDYNNPGKTFAKAIDEFNYVNITLPLQARKKARRGRSA